MLIDERVVGDPKQPGPEVTPFAEPAQPRHGLQERFLAQVLGTLPVMRR